MYVRGYVSEKVQNVLTKYRQSSFNAIFGLRKTALQEEYLGTKTGKGDFNLQNLQKKILEKKVYKVFSEKSR